MKKLLAIVVITALFAPLAMAEKPAASESCGTWFEMAREVGLPLTYCFARQWRGNVTYGQLNIACEGSACTQPKSIFDL